MVEVPLNNQIEQRFGVLPNFFRLASDTPEVTANLWGFAQFAYLDSPLPSLFKERLFVYLSRFCEVRYCIARHVGFLVGLGYPAGDRHCPPQTIEQVLPLLQRPLPRGKALEPAIARCAASNPDHFDYPNPDTAEEGAIFACATHVFLQTPDAPRAIAALRQGLGATRMESLNVFLAFVRMAHYWTQIHPELHCEDDINHLLATHEALANCLLNDPEVEDNALSQRMWEELAELRQLKAQHESLAQAYDVVSRKNKQLQIERQERQRVEENLRESEEKYRTLFNSIDEGFCSIEVLYDENGQPVDHRILEANSAFEKHTGLTQARGRLASELMPGVEQAWNDLYARVVATGKSEQLEQHSPAFSRWFDVEVSRIGERVLRRVAVFFRDITERKAADEALRQSEERLKLAVEGGRMVAWEWNPFHDTIITTANFPEIYGLPKIRTAEQGFTLVHPEDRSRHQATVENAVATGSNYQSEFRFIRPDNGAIAWLNEWGQVILNDDGSLQKLIGVTSDITDRKEAEELLRLSEQRLKLALKTGKLGSWQLELKTNELFTSEQCKINYGVLPDADFSHQVLFDRIHPDDRAWVEDAIQQAIIQHSEYDVEYRTVWDDGTVHWALVRGTVIYDTDETPLRMVGMSLDITDRKLAEEQLRASHDTFRDLVENSPFGVYVVDADFRIAQVSAGAQKAFENVRPLIGRDFAEAMHVLWPESFASEAIARFRHTLETGEPYHAPSTIELRRDVGEVESYDWKIERIMLPDGRFGVVCHFYDLSERQRYETALREGEERFRNMADNAPMMVWVADATGYCTYLSRSWYDFTGQTEATGLGLGWLDATHPDDRESSQAIFLAAHDRQESFQLEYRLRHRDGHYRTCIDAAKPWFGVNGEFKGYIGSVIDIDDRKQAEKRQAFLLKLSDALRPLTDASEIQAIAVRILGESLGATRVIYIEVVSEGEEVIVHCNYTNGVAELSGRYRLEDYRRNLTDNHQAGCTQVVIDIPDNPNYTPAEKTRYREIDIAAHIDVPLLKNNQFVALLAVHQSTPRQWTEIEVNLVEETAELTWAAVERARAEAALRESEAKYRMLFESIDEGFCVIEMLFDENSNPSDYRFLQTNPAFEKQSGLLNAQGKRMLELAPNHEEYWFEIYGNVALTGEPNRFENYAAALNRWYNIYAFRIGHPDERKVAVLLTDISERVHVEDERKRIEHTLRQSEARFRRIFDCEMVPMGIWTIAGEIVDTNHALLDLIGYTRQELETGQINWQALTPPEYLTLDQNALSEIAIQGFSSAYEKVYVHKDGRPIPILVGAASFLDDPNSGVFFVIDLTVRKQTEAQLREAHVQLEAALAAGAIYTWRWQIPEDRVIVNAAFAHLFGVDPELAAVGLPIELFVQAMHADDRPQVVAAINQAIKTGEEYAAEFRVYTADGEERWLYARGRVEYDADGRPLAFPGALADITERKTAEQEREQLLQREQTAREQAETANRIKDEFLAVLSHELRSPLNPILGWSKLLQQGKLNAEKTRAALTTIERNAQLQVQLIDDLLDVSRILRGKLSLTIMPVDLSAVISAALETVRLAAQAKAIQIQTTVSPGVGIVMGDAGRLQQVVWNLLSNAVKFTPHGGQVTVALASDKNHAQIQVTDTGKGIRFDFLPYVFEHFRQEDGATTRKFGGLGLGLAIARQIVEMHGGQISVDSPGEGEGATFTVQIPPASHSNTILPAIEQPSKLTRDLSGIRILVVDDEADSREFVAFVLEQANASIISVASGIDALQAFSQSVPDLIVSDIGMPEMDGYMLMRQIRSLALEQGGQIPAIALTAYAGELDQHQAISAGFQKHLAKPIDPAALITAIIDLEPKNVHLQRADSS